MQLFENDCEGQKRQFCPIIREFPILFSGTEVLTNFKAPNSFLDVILILLQKD